MAIQNVRLEVMQFLGEKIDSFVDEFLIPVEKIWQPTDLLPNSQNESFFEEVKELREIAKDLTYDFWVKFNDNANSYRSLITQADPSYTNSVELVKSRSGYQSGKVYFNFNGNVIFDTLDGSILPTSGILNYTAIAKKTSGVYVLYLYRNGVLVDQLLNPTVSTYNMNTWSNFQTRIGDATSIYSAFMNGNIYISRMYNKALSASEVTQNFNATKTRFGL